VEPVPEYYIGGRDNVLEEALKRVVPLVTGGARDHGP
jgi:hypothetical protein